jgi:hypothetical protein
VTEGSGQGGGEMAGGEYALKFFGFGSGSKGEETGSGSA